MSSIIKVDQIQLADGSTPTAGDLGMNTTGNILQVVQGTSTAGTTTTSQSFTDTGLSASITPTSTSSKVLVIVSHPSTGVVTATSASDRVRLRLVRGSTAITGMANLSCYTNSTTRATDTVTTTYLDSPSTTLATTYKTQFCNEGSGCEVIVNWNAFDSTPAAPSTLTLIEIAG